MHGAWDSLGDDLVLLSIDPRSGWIRNSETVGFALMGSELVRLAAGGRVGVTTGQLVVHRAEPTADQELDAALASIAQAPRPLSAERWVSHPRRGICASYLERLATAGTVRKERRVLTRWRIVDDGRVAQARSRLDAVAFAAASAAPPDLTEAAFGGLAYAAGLVASLYPWRQRREINDRLKLLAAARALAQSPTEAAVRTATEAAEQAAFEAAVRAAMDSAVQAAASAAHSVSAGHGGHGGGHGGH